MSGAQRMVIDEPRPNPRKVRQAAQVLEKGGVICYPTDTVYGLGCDVHDRKAVERIYRIKRMGSDRRLSFICHDLAHVAQYTIVTDFAYRWLRRLLPGPYTVVLPAGRAVPKILLQKRKEVGIRIPDHEFCIELVKTLGHPLISTSATDPDTSEPLVDPDLLKERLGRDLDLILDGGLLTAEPSTVLSLVDNQIEIIREGKGPVAELVG